VGIYVKSSIHSSYAQPEVRLWVLCSSLGVYLDGD